MNSLTWQQLLAPEVVCSVKQFAQGKLSDIKSVPEAENFRVSTDSREDLNGAVFIPLRGENFDGEDFLQAAYDAGSRILVYTRASSLENLRLEESAWLIKVTDGLDYYLALANTLRKQAGINVIAVTGSVGKTSCRHWIMAGLETRFQVDGTKKNLNNPIGVAQSIFALDTKADVAVLELGMDRAGEIQQSARAAMPDRAVITNVGTSHLAHFANREEILHAKLEILDGMVEDAPLHLRWDEDLLSEWILRKGQARKNLHLYAPAASIHDPQKLPDLPLVTADYDETKQCLVFKSYDQGELQDVQKLTCPAPELHHLGHLAVTYQIMRECFEVTEEDLQAMLDNFQNEGSRGTYHQIGDVTVIDDAYNASPESMRAAFMSLKQRKVKNAIACIAAVNELGDRAAELHEQIGQDLVKSGVFEVLMLKSIMKITYAG